MKSVDEVFKINKEVADNKDIYNLLKEPIICKGSKRLT
jgi:hypothetical protein